MQQQTTTTGAAVGAARAGGGADAEVFLTLSVAGQSCAVPVRGVRDVLGAQAITRIPLAPPEVAGSLNLRGRIVTAIDLRRRLGLGPRRASDAAPMSVVVEQGTELYSLLCDSVGDVVPLDADGFAPNPPTLDPAWREFSRGVHRGGGGTAEAAQHGAAAAPGAASGRAGGDGLTVVLDVERVLALGA